MKTMLSNIPLFIAAFILLFRILPTYFSQSKMEGEKFHHFELPTLNGELVKSENTSGARKVYVFWATWCMPCRLELSRIQSLIDEKKIKAEDILAISSLESTALLRKTAKKRGYTFPILADERGEVSSLFQIRGVPTLIFKERDDKIAKVSSGLSPLLSFHLKNFLD